LFCFYASNSEELKIFLPQMQLLHNTLNCLDKNLNPKKNQEDDLTYRIQYPYIEFITKKWERQLNIIKKPFKNWSLKVINFAPDLVGDFASDYLADTLEEEDEYYPFLEIEIIHISTKTVPFYFTKKRVLFSGNGSMLGLEKLWNLPLNYTKIKSSESLKNKITRASSILEVGNPCELLGYLFEIHFKIIEEVGVLSGIMDSEREIMKKIIQEAKGGTIFM
jgi:hypothetical protein